MATQSHGIQQRARTKTAPSFPRERQHQQQQPQQPQLTQQHPVQPYYIPHTPQAYMTNNHLGDLDAWRLQSLHTAPISGPPRRSSRGPRTSSPIRSLDPQSRVFSWDQQPNHFPSSQQRQQFRRKSVTSNTSSSDHHNHLRSPRPSRSPSPGTPRNSLSSRPLRTPMSNDYNKRVNNRKMTGQSNSGSNSGSGCSFETALVNSRRRIPYSMGSDSLAVVPPGSYHARLDEKDERCLSVDILDLYHVFSLSFSG
jgi:hypothetical protein